MSDQNNTEKSANEELKDAHRLGFASHCLGTDSNMSQEQIGQMYSTAESFTARNHAVADTLKEQAEAIRSN
jgi:hypothetical protein